MVYATGKILKGCRNIYDDKEIYLLKKNAQNLFEQSQWMLPHSIDNNNNTYMHHNCL